MRHKFNWVIALLFIAFLPSCTDKNTPEQPEEQQPKYYVIYDTDIGSSTDDLFALKILYNASKRGQCELIGGVVCREDSAGNWEPYVKLADLMNTYYGYPNLPLGVERNGVRKPHAYIPYTGIAQMKNADSTLMFKRTISDYSTLPDGYKLHRKLLAQQPDGETSILAIGFMSTVAHLLESEGDEYSPLNGVELVSKKVKALYVMAGKFGEDGNLSPGYNFGHNADALAFTRTVLNKWPKNIPIYISPSPVGDEVEYPKDEVLRDIDWTDVEPIKQTYLNYNVATGQMMWDLLSAMEATEHHFTDLCEHSEPGFVILNDNNELIFTPDPAGNCRYQVLPEGKKETIVSAFKDVMHEITKYHR